MLLQSLDVQTYKVGNYKETRKCETIPCDLCQNHTTYRDISLPAHKASHSNYRQFDSVQVYNFTHGNLNTHLAEC